MSHLQVENLSIAFGGVHAIEDLSFDIQAATIHSIIGPNGAGKTTLFNLITGLYRPSAGRIRFEEEDVMVGRHLREPKNPVAHVLRLPSQRRSESACRERARELLDFVGLSAYAGEAAGSMPYGALKRLEIARALAAEPKMLLLDEPAAGCNPTETREIDDLIQKIAEQGVTVVLVEHDMHLVMNISNHILVLDYGRKLADGTAAEVRANPEVIAAYLGAQGQEEFDRAQG